MLGLAASRSSVVQCTYVAVHGFASAPILLPSPRSGCCWPIGRDRARPVAIPPRLGRKASSTPKRKLCHRDPGSGGRGWKLDLALREGWFVLQEADRGVILLDTNALIWVHTGRARSGTRARERTDFYELSTLHFGDGGKHGHADRAGGLVEGDCAIAPCRGGSALDQAISKVCLSVLEKAK